jgi:hypothetical protein
MDLVIQRWEGLGKMHVKIIKTRCKIFKDNQIKYERRETSVT